MTRLGDHLRSRVRYLEGRVRSGMRIRHERAWFDDHPSRFRAYDEDDYPEPWVYSPRLRLNHTIRKTIAKLRTARAHLAEFRRLKEAA